MRRTRRERSAISLWLALVWVLASLTGSLALPLAIHAQETGEDGTLPPVPQSDPFFGIVQAIHDPYRAVNAGVRWERLVLWWSNVQPNGPEDWNPEGWFARNLIEDEKKRGIEPVGLVIHTPGWAARDGGYGPISPPRNLGLPFDAPENYWGQFLTRLAHEYAGLVDTWVLWNEPDIYRETYANWAGSVDEFARLQVVGYQAIKRGNPQAQVLLTGTTYWWDVENGRTQYLERLLTRLLGEPGAAENNAFFDGVSVHQYGNPLNVYAVTTLYRRILAQHGLERPFWIDESNVVPYDDPLRPLPRGGLRATMEEQSNYMIQAAALARAAGAARYAVYKMRDEEAENDQYYGLVRNDGQPRLAYTAYQVAVRELSNTQGAQYFWGGSATPPSEDEITALLASTDSRPQFVWPSALNGVRMRRGADRVTVMWNASAAPLQVGAMSSAITATVVDKYGRSQPAVRAADGSFRLTLASATNNTDARDPSLVLVGGDPLILIEQGATGAPDPLPRPVDACWDVSGAQVPYRSIPVAEPVEPQVPVTATQAAVEPQIPVTATQTSAAHAQPPVAEVEASAAETQEDTWVAPTGYAVSGPWLAFYRSHGDVDNIGYPRSPVVADPLNPKQCIQYFQRVVLEWHPENPPEYLIQRRLLAADGLLASELGGEDAAAGPDDQATAPEADAVESPAGPNSADYWYFPKGPNGLGFAVSNLAPDGNWIGFKSYFDRFGREDAFGYPMEPPTRRTGSDRVERWTQRFQAAVFEFHPEFDRDDVKPGTDLPWRTWMVQLRLLGDEYLAAGQLPFINGDPAAYEPVPPEPTPTP